MDVYILGSMNSTMILFTICILMAVTSVLSASQQGHMEPIGNQRKSEGHIDVTDEIPDAMKFFNDYVKASKPIVFKGAAKKLPAFSKWSDDYLKKEFGHVTVDVEEGKKENRSLAQWQWPLKKFLESYKEEDVYLVHTLGQEWRKDLRLLPCMSCGGYSNLLQMLVMWFSSGGTRSVLHNDGTENINCLFSGSKKLYMVDFRHREFIDLDAPEGGFSKVNVEAVDLNKYPGLAKAPWWEANMEAGDCLYIPYRWFHHVSSFTDEKEKKNMAVNIWWFHTKNINTTDCENHVSSFLPFDGLTVTNANVEAVRFILLLPFGKDNVISTSKMYKHMKQYFSRGEVDRNTLLQIRSILDKDKDKKITLADINSLTTDELKTVSVVFPGIYNEELQGEKEDGEEEELGDEVSADNKEEL